MSEELKALNRIEEEETELGDLAVVINFAYKRDLKLIRKALEEFSELKERLNVLINSKRRIVKNEIIGNAYITVRELEELCKGGNER